MAPRPLPAPSPDPPAGLPVGVCLDDDAADQAEDLGQVVVGVGDPRLLIAAALLARDVEVQNALEQACSR